MAIQNLRVTIEITGEGNVTTLRRSLGFQRPWPIGEAANDAQYFMNQLNDETKAEVLKLTQLEAEAGRGGEGIPEKERQ